MPDFSRVDDARPRPGGDQAAAQLEAQLAALRSNIENLGAAKSWLIDETIAQFARSLSENLEGLRHCPPTDGPAEAAGRVSVTHNYPD